MSNKKKVITLTLTIMIFLPFLTIIKETQSTKTKLYTPNEADAEDVWWLERINAPDAWQVTNGSDIVVAVLSSGIDFTHPEITHCQWTNEAEKNGIDGVDDDGNDYIDDYYGWDFSLLGEDNDTTPSMDPDFGFVGTALAGVIAAKINDIGVAGIAQDVKIMDLQIWIDDTYPDWGMIEARIEKAILYAADNGADVALLAYYWNLAGFWDECKYAREQNVTLVSTVDYHWLVEGGGQPGCTAPATYDSVICVGGTNYDDAYCDIADYCSSTELVAPCGDQYDLEIAPDMSRCIKVLNRTHGYRYFSHPLLAGAQVTATAALMKAANESITEDQLRRYLWLTSSDDGLEGIDVNIGYGMLNVSAAVEAVIYGLDDIIEDCSVGVHLDCSVTVNVEVTDLYEVDNVNIDLYKYDLVTSSYKYLSTIMMTGNEENSEFSTLITDLELGNYSIDIIVSDDFLITETFNEFFDFQITVCSGIALPMVTIIGSTGFTMIFVITRKRKKA